jgi:hypothetical protein
MTEIRTAQAGDICVLLMPEPEELPPLRQMQEELMRTFGGWIAAEVHVTCQRFEPPFDRKIHEVVLKLRTALARVPAFAVIASGLTQFHAPFWQSYVLRWQVEYTPEFKAFILALDGLLEQTGIIPHYPHNTPFTCSALDLITPVQLEFAPRFNNPLHLVTARRVVFSRVMGLNDFETLGFAQLSQ